MPFDSENGDDVQVLGSGVIGAIYQGRNVQTQSHSHFRTNSSSSSFILNTH
jgi:hypothetical protein